MQPDTQQKVVNVVNKVGVIIIFAYFSIFLFFLGFYIHEFGHILFGTGNSLFLGEGIPKITISSWISHPLIPFLKLPQQTMILRGKGSVNFIFGGIIFSVLFWTFFAWILYRQSNQKISFFIPLIILIMEIVGNYFCGTDNLTNNPLDVCSSLHLNFFVKYFPFLFAILLTIIFIRSNLFKKILSFL